MCSNRSCLWLLSGLCYLQHLDPISLEALCLGIFCPFIFSPSPWENMVFVAAKLRWTECASCPASPSGQMNSNLELCFIFAFITTHCILWNVAFTGGILMLQRFFFFKDYLTEEVYNFCILGSS